MKTAFNFDEVTMSTLQELMEHYDLESISCVLSKAIALLSLASKFENEDGNLVLLLEDDSQLKIIMR